MMRDIRSWYGNAAIVLACVFGVSLLGWVVYMQHARGPATATPIATSTEPEPIVDSQPAKARVVSASPARPPARVVAARSPLTQAEMMNAAREQADQCAQATVNNDYGRAVQFMHPKLVEKLGGEARAIASIRDGMQQVAARGMTLQAVSVGNVTQIKESQSQIFAVIPQYLVAVSARGTLRSQSYLIGVSEDGGRNWTFIDSSGAAGNPARIRELLPNLPDDLELPTP